ncbi:hypothetical protein CATMIT_01752, partial [Catenibacterium mitsuokai DSM 15897]
ADRAFHRGVVVDRVVGVVAVGLGARARPGAGAGGLAQLAEEGQAKLGERHAVARRVAHVGQRVRGRVDVRRVAAAGGAALEVDRRRETGRGPRGMVGAAVAAGVATERAAQISRMQIAQELLQRRVRVIGDQTHRVGAAVAVVGHVQLQHADHVDAAVLEVGGDGLGAAQAHFLGGVTHELDRALGLVAAGQGHAQHFG